MLSQLRSLTLRIFTKNTISTSKIKLTFGSYVSILLPCLAHVRRSGLETP